jgi:hypothetical protein
MKERGIHLDKFKYHESLVKDFFMNTELSSARSAERGSFFYQYDNNKSNHMKKFKHKSKLKVNTHYNKSVAIRFHKTEYYKAMATDIIMLPKKEQEKRKFSADHQNSVSDSIEFFKSVDYTKLWKVLKGIYLTRKKMAYGLTPHKKAGQLMPILTNKIFLATCYQTIKKKKGAMTKAQATRTT